MIKADLHIHTVLSPCGDIEMSPAFLVCRAKELGVGVIGITDHNSTRQCAEVRRIGEREGVFVLCGAEVTTREEVHVLVFAESGEPLVRLQDYLDNYLPAIENNPEYFGYQLVVNEQEEVIYEERRLLINAIDQSIEEVEAFTRSIGGIFIPAHVDKAQNSLISQLGFVPPHLNTDALEVSHRCDADLFKQENAYLTRCRFIRSSDAHYPEEFGRATIGLDIEKPCFEAVKDAIIQNRILL